MKISPHAVSTLLLLAWVEFRLSGYTQSKAVETPGDKEGTLRNPEDFHKLETKVEEIARLQNRRLENSDSLFQCAEDEATEIKLCSPIDSHAYFNFPQGIVIGEWNPKCNYGAGIFSVDGPSDSVYHTYTNCPQGSGTVTFGSNNIASGHHSSVTGGNGNSASGDYSSISGGLNNKASGLHSFVSGGASNVASGIASSSTGILNSGMFATISCSYFVESEKIMFAIILFFYFVDSEQQPTKILLQS